MSLHLTRSAAGFALLAALAACGGTAAAAHLPGGKPAAPAVMHSRIATPMPATGRPASRHPGTRPPAQAPASTPPAQPPATTSNPIPQGNGGDQDADNNGGPSDGDGNL
jgi:hypothetical protein